MLDLENTKELLHSSYGQVQSPDRFVKICSFLARGACPPDFSMDCSMLLLGREHAEVFANTLRSASCPTHLLVNFSGLRYWAEAGDRLIERAIQQSPHLYGLDIQIFDPEEPLHMQFSDDSYGPKMYRSSLRMLELARQNRAAHAGAVALTLLQGLTQPDSKIHCLRSNFNMVQMILECICPNTIAKKSNAEGYATRFANNVLSWHNDRQSGKTIQSKLPRILGHKKRATALRLALSKLNVLDDRLTLIENQLGCYDRTKPRPELPAVLKDRLDDQTFQELNRDFKRRPINKTGAYYALLSELKRSIPQPIAGAAESVLTRNIAL